MHRWGGDVTASDYHTLIPDFLEENLRPNRSKFCMEMAELEYTSQITCMNRVMSNGEAYEGSLLHFQRDD